MIDSRTCEGGRSIRRRRECLHCAKRFTTYERVEQITRLMVVKKDGRRVPWDREKILGGPGAGVLQAAVPESELLRIADEVEEEVNAATTGRCPAPRSGSSVTDKLRRLDQVAYVRFASVYRQFKTLEELVDEAQAVIDARRYEDPPGQGRLFVEPAAARCVRRPNGEGHGDGTAAREPARDGPAPSRRTAAAA